MKYIFDTDPGIDDTIAIMMGYLNGMDIIGFTLETGNISLDKSENNIKVIQDFLGTNIKMFKGSTINKCGSNAEFVHGKDGLGYAVFPKNKRKIEKMSAEDFMIKASKKYKDDLTIVCLGPVTNLAAAIRKDPSIAYRVKHLVIMGHTYNPLDKEPYEEFNVMIDPDAAKLVMSAPFEDIKIITHEAVTNMYVEKEYVDNLRMSENLISRFIGLIAQKYMEFCLKYYNYHGLGSPDASTIASMINPRIAKLEYCTVDVEKDSNGKVRSIVKLVPKSNIKIATSYNEEEFRKTFKKTFK